MNRSGHIAQLMQAAVGASGAEAVLSIVRIAPSLLDERDGAVSRAAFAMALNGILFHDLLQRVPTGAAYVEDQRRAQRPIVLDHGALRTIRFADGPTGELPGGFLAFARILEPLGYEVTGLYPLERLGMTGRGFTHRDLAEDIPQFFVSELHVERFSLAFQTVARRVFGATREPLGEDARSALEALAKHGRCELDLAERALPQLAAAFGRWHPLPSLADYEALKRESPEAAWISTEGNAFNHATARVPDVAELSEQQRRLGRAIKADIEVSALGRVRQTAFRADAVVRRLPGPAGLVEREAPGSFFEFISRAREGGADGPLDLRFDSANAQGIFAMTSGPPSQ
jgi:hypothetical protein